MLRDKFPGELPENCNEKQEVSASRKSSVV